MNKELIEAIKPACKWVKENLNPHQELVITLDEITIKNYELGIPSKVIEEEEQ